jgi:hypothetical protein
MSLKIENSRRVAKSRPVCMDLYTRWFQHYTRCFRHYTRCAGAFTIYIRGAFAIIRSSSSIKCSAFNIIRDHRCFHSTLFPYTSMACI